MEGLKLYIFPDIGSVIMTIHSQKELKRKWLNKCINISGLFVTLKLFLFFFSAIYIHLLNRNTGFFPTGPDTLAMFGNISATTINLK